MSNTDCHGRDHAHSGVSKGRSPRKAICPKCDMLTDNTEGAVSAPIPCGHCGYVATHDSSGNKPPRGFTHIE